MKLNQLIFKRTLALSLLMLNVSFMSSGFAACNTNVPATTPTSDFTVNNDGTVTHNTTELMWKVCSEGQTWNSGDGSCNGSPTGHSWQQALQIPQTLNVAGGYAGHTDWRLPNIKELKSIVEMKCAPGINTDIFNNTPGKHYWSSSPFLGSSNYAWGVDFLFGASGVNRARFNSDHVRLVRTFESSDGFGGIPGENGQSSQPGVDNESADGGGGSGAPTTQEGDRGSVSVDDGF